MIFKRNPMKGMRMIGNSILSIVMIGLIFLNAVGQNRPSQNEIYPYQSVQYYFIRVQGSNFIAIVSCIMSGIFSVSLACKLFLISVPQDKEIYYKETSSKKYLPIAYLIAKILIQAGAVIVGTVIYAVGAYFMIGFSISFLQLLKFGTFLCYSVISLSACALVGNSLGILTGTLFKEAKSASALTPIVLLPLMMFSGLYNKLNSIPVWIRWLQYLSPFRYGLQSVLLNQFNDEKYLTLEGRFYDYRQDLSANLSYDMNIIILVGLAVMYYGISFVLLKKMSSNLAP